MIGIYKITSPSGKIYIGQTWNSRKRFNNYNCLYCKAQPKLYNSLKKYYPKNHVIEMILELPENISQDIMDKYESFYIFLYKEEGAEMLNIREGGSRGKHSEETKRKMSDNWNRPIKTKEVKEQISNSLKEYYKINGSYNSKKVVQMDRDGNTIRIWNSSRQAAEVLGIQYKGISQIVNGHRPTYKGFKWKLY